MAGVTSYPQVTIQLLPAATVDAFAERNDLIVGQLGTGGTAVDGALTDNVQSMSASDLRNAFGAGELYWRIKQWQLGNDGYTPMSVIGLDPAAGSASTANVVFSGTATGTGTIKLECVDGKQFDISVSVAVGDTAATIATAINTAFGNLENYPPVTSSVSTATVTFTADDVGTIGNYYSLKVTGVVAGISYVVTGFSGGATDPSVTGIFDVIEGERYTNINWPEFWKDSVDEVTDMLDERFNADNDIMDGTAYMGLSDTYANLLSFVASINTQNLIVGGNNKVANDNIKGSAIIQPASWTMAYFQGVQSKRLTTGSPIASDIVALNSPLDAIGGAHSASLPFFNTPLNYCPVTASANLFSNTEQNALTSAGVTTFGVNRALNGMIMGSVATTRTTDAAGNSNNSFLYANYVWTGSVCREVFYNVLKATFAQSRLAEGSARPGYSVANEETIRAELGSVYRVLANVALLESGDVAESYFSDNTTVSISKSTRSVTITSLLPIVTQLESIDYPLTLSFSITETGTSVTL